MAEEYRYRQYRQGDAATINHLYEYVVGRPRSVSQFEWQWLRAPGGKGEIWLIEAVNNRRETTLIGHHGIMPIRFSLGQENLLFGKTENTMVRPEYRTRILYPRFERRFAEKYESRFDALFSTMGPAAALRQRRAMGYEFPVKWVRVQIPTSSFASIRLIFRAYLARLTGRRSADAGIKDQSESFDSQIRLGAPSPLRALADQQARDDSFFESFWPDVRARYGLTPRRDREDLNWRFWSNPYSEHITLVSDNTPDDSGYVIIRRDSKTPDAATIEDIVPSEPTTTRFFRLIDSAVLWMRDNNIHWADFSTTDDACVAGGIAEGLESRNMLVRRWQSRIRGQTSTLMPRKLTLSGRNKGLDISSWYITPIVFEGRGG